jgi:hypothetical protein
MNELSYLENLNNAFNSAERIYKKTVMRIESGKYELPPISKNSEVVKEITQVNYRDIQNIPPTDYLNNLEVDWRRTGKLKQEIETNWLNNNKNYFIFLEHRMAHHFRFVKQNCGDAFSFFTMEKKESYNLINKLRHVGTTLTKNEALLAMKLDFIDLFSTFEETIKNSYPGYLKLLNLSLNNEQPRKIQPIFLDYGALNNAEIIRILHEALKTHFITESLSSFADHFSDVEKVTPKMRWNGKLTVLYAIFNDATITVKDSKIKLPGISIKNVPIYDTIANHFCNSSGESLKPNSIRVEMIGQKKGETVPGFEDLLPALNKINSYKNR